ncbi:MAG TPA: DNA methyltransferase [Myxococcota bacterium]
MTSLPDVSEVGMDLPSWRAWFLDAVHLVVDAVHDDSVALFFQTDIKKDGRLVDKGALVVRASEDAGAHVLFHKIVCRKPPGTVTFGRPAFTHLLAVSRSARAPGVLAVPDVVVDAGRLTWVRAMGMRACAHAVRFARDHAPTRSILDPFCGVGTVLAVANALGLDAVGVERSKKRAAQARALTLTGDDVNN